jgi:hypothetical protein
MRHGRKSKNKRFDGYRTHLGSLVGKDYSKYGESDRAAPPSLGAKRSVPRRSPVGGVFEDCLGLCLEKNRKESAIFK